MMLLEMRFSSNTACKAIAILQTCQPSSLVVHTDTFVCFRGTTTISDVLHDAQFRQFSTPVGRVHSGFRKLYRSLHHELRYSTPPPTVVAGHSMGGALAVLYAFDLYSRGLTPPEVYVFGMPKIADSTFLKRYDAALGARTYRVQNLLDVIPTLPPFDNYHHVGTFVNCTFDRGSWLQNHDLENYYASLLE